MPIGNGDARRLRLEAGLTQKELSDLCGVNARTISRFETGGNVSSSKVAGIADGLSLALNAEVAPAELLISQLETSRLQIDPQGRLSKVEYARRLKALELAKKADAVRRKDAEVVSWSRFVGQLGG